MVSFPTHNKGNILDLVLTDGPDSVYSVASHGRLGRSDHDMILIKLDVGAQQKKRPELTKNWRRADWSSMKEEMGQHDWQAEMDELRTEDAWKLFKTTVDALVERHVPLRVIRTNGRPPWLSVSLLQEIRHKRRL